MAIKTWLLKVLSDGVSIPRMVVCDFSHALLIAILIAIARKIDLRDYMQCCFDILKGKSYVRPATYIRLDVSHVVAIICRWDCIRRHPLIKVRQFFIRSLCHPYQIQSFEELERFMLSVLTIALSQTLGSVSGEKLPSQQEFDRVNSIIKGMSNLEMIKSINTSIENQEESANFEEDCSAGWIDWSTAIDDKASYIALKCTDGEILNACCNLDVAHKIKQLMRYCAIWTGVMSLTFQVDYKVATSSSVESGFANLKRLFKTELPLRADKIVLRHITYLDGHVKEASIRNVKNQSSTAPAEKRKDGNREKKTEKKRKVKEQPVTENKCETSDISCHTNDGDGHHIINFNESNYCCEQDNDSVIECNDTSKSFVGMRGNESRTINTNSKKKDEVFCTENSTEQIKNENNAEINDSCNTSCVANDENREDMICDFHYFTEPYDHNIIKDEDVSTSIVAVKHEDSRTEQTSLKKRNMVTCKKKPNRKMKIANTAENLVENNPLRAIENWGGLGELKTVRKNPTTWMHVLIGIMCSRIRL